MSDDQNYTIKEMLGRLEAKVDKVIDDHEIRLRSLERLTNKWLGVVGFVAGIAGLASNYLH